MRKHFSQHKLKLTETKKNRKKTIFGKAPKGGLKSWSGCGCRGSVKKRDASFRRSR